MLVCPKLNSSLNLGFISSQINHSNDWTFVNFLNNMEEKIYHICTMWDNVFLFVCYMWCSHFLLWGCIYINVCFITPYISCDMSQTLFCENKLDYRPLQIRNGMSHVLDGYLPVDAAFDREMQTRAVWQTTSPDEHCEVFQIVFVHQNHSPEAREGLI